MAQNRNQPPQAEDLKQLPLWAQVAFAARCARRVLPLFNHYWVKAPKGQTKAINTSIEISELAAGSDRNRQRGPVVTAIQRFYKLRRQARFYRGTDDAVFRCVAAAASSLDATEAALIDIKPTVTYRVGSAVAAAVGAAQRINQTAGRVLASIWRDFDVLAERARHERWDDETPVPPSVFGAMWPEGPPKGWPGSVTEDADEPQVEQTPQALTPTPEIDQRMTVRFTIPPMADTPHNRAALKKHLRDTLVAINELHLAKGGSGFKIDRVQALVPENSPSPAPEPVPSGGGGV